MGPFVKSPGKMGDCPFYLRYYEYMPEISRFLGIVIAMFYRDHAPPHFHAAYGNYEIRVYINTGIVQGRFPKRALRHVLEWGDLHQVELLDNWTRLKTRKPLKTIAPLE